jgi:hypothetical protein
LGRGETWAQDEVIRLVTFPSAMAYMAFRAGYDGFQTLLIGA